MNLSHGRMAKGALFIALGVLFPQLFHLVGFGGPVFLPMHIPVLLAGLLVCPIAGLYVGLITPILSYFLTGMPPMSPPILPIMIFELAIYGLVAGVLYRKLKLNIFVSLIGAMISGRIMYGFVLVIMLNIFAIQLPPGLTLKAAILTGMPGMLIQLTFIPILVKSLVGGLRDVKP
ncbi:MAG: ECF transporter S component [Clostridiales bacterium]|nr:ECF transporter S component [Clostridiales bacterium]